MTTAYSCDQKISKSSAIAEALGSLDEINSFLGLVKAESKNVKWKAPGSALRLDVLVHSIQETLFIVQAEVAGFLRPFPEGKVKKMEKIIDAIEKILPPIKTFFISGGTKLAALFDVARTIARRAERRIVEVAEKKSTKISPETFAVMNRLSSLLYALARLSAYKSGINEKSPSYK